MKKAKGRETLRMRMTLRWRLTLFVFLVMILSGVMTALIYIFFLLLFGKTPFMILLMLNPIFLCLILLLVSSLIGTLLAAFMGKLHLRPIKLLSQATGEIRKGNYKVRVDQVVSDDSEMGMLIANFNEMVKELDGIELFRNDFINNFSHEFKTPIVSIRGFAKEIQYGDLDEEQRREYLKIIVEESDRLSKLSGSILELSKLENQQIVTDKAEFYLDEQLRQCILLQEAAWSGKQIEMIPELDEVQYFGNEELTAHIWMNLISNAIKFSNPCGMIRVTLTADEREITVRVIDSGIGMTEEIKGHIFEKFYQGDLSHHKSGYGVGLTMVSRAVTLCRGSISVESAPNEGSTFTVKLPRK